MSKLREKPAADTVKQHGIRYSHPANAKLSLYAALNGYIEVFSPAPSYMIGKSYKDRTPESWLEIAENAMRHLGEEETQPIGVIEEVKRLVKQGKYDKARDIVRRGIQEASAELRRTL